MMHKVLWIILALAFLPKISAFSCGNYGLLACLDVNKRPDYPCGRTLCVDQQVCAWCLHTPGSANGTCLTYDVCNVDPNFNTSHFCYGGVVLTTNGHSCSFITTEVYVLLALLSLLPAFVMLKFTQLFLIGFHAKFSPLTKSATKMLTLLGGLSVYVMLVCFMTLFSLNSWAVLLFPLFIFPLCMCCMSYTTTFCEGRCCNYGSQEAGECQGLLVQVELPQK
jgi:hypothetical protein